MLRTAARGAGVTIVGGAGLAYASSPGFRRSVTFWSTVAPFFLEFNGIKLRARLEGCDTEELERRKTAFHHKTAARAVDVVTDLGGIYVKIGQFVSTIGAGILEDEYITALQPLQDGVPPRPYASIAAIIEAEVGASMKSLFSDFEEVPVGAASIAQAHRATLASTGERVIVKVQYPEVARLYKADFDNLEVVTRYLFPENMKLIEGLRRRHQAELDFRTEAANLREVSANMTARGFEPRLVRVPRVPDARLVTRCVLAMELLEGRSLAAVIDAEHAELAASLGLKGGGGELRRSLQARMRRHFEEGGGGSDDGGGDGGRGGGLIDAGTAATILTPVAAALRAYASARRRLLNGLSWLTRVLSGGRVVLLRASVEPPPDLGALVRTLVAVHGCQMLLDGVYNADPHPGNVVVLRDGRLGLIDYGMVGRLTPHDRGNIARVLVALRAKDERRVAQIYDAAGYRACWHSGEPHNAAVIHRLATFHLDRVDLSPVAARDGKGEPKMAVMKVLTGTIEHAVPDWIEQARRLGGLLIGVGSQVGRPLSLAHEWAPLAKQVLDAEARQGVGVGALPAAAPQAQPIEEVDVPLPLQRRPSRTLRLLKETVSGQ